ncbi:MAG: TetR/AcrR family transcriptional regulator [Myxococcota bacterium]
MNTDPDRRASILAAARVRYAQDGPEKTSLRQIAKDAGVSVALVYHYFQDKDELYNACVGEMYQELIGLAQTAQANLASNKPPEEFLEETVRQGFRFACEQRTWVLMLQRRVLDRGGLDPDRVESLREPFLAAAGDALAKATGQSPAFARLAIQSIVFLVVRYSLSEQEELRGFIGTDVADPVTAIEDHLVDVTFRTFLGRPSASNS